MAYSERRPRGFVHSRGKTLVLAATETMPFPYEFDHEMEHSNASTFVRRAVLVLVEKRDMGRSGRAMYGLFSKPTQCGS